MSRMVFTKCWKLWFLGRKACFFLCIIIDHLKMIMCLKNLNKNLILGNSLAVQWLGLDAFTAVARVQFLVRELRSCKRRGVSKKNPQKLILKLINRSIVMGPVDLPSLTWFSSSAPYGCSSASQGGSVWMVDNLHVYRPSGLNWRLGDETGHLVVLWGSWEE